jgi:flavin reductase (DIM6/NTAB) family NADH-FMN oxidoreductase RutF
VSHPTRNAPDPGLPLHFRSCLGAFATGVTIVATRAADGSVAGLTVNSFNSLSLDPPLVLWSLRSASGNAALFREATNFSVSVLAAGQLGLARHFALSAPERFAGVAHHEGLGGCPLVDAAIAWFECETVSVQELGDHLLFIGRVLRCARVPGVPLVFHHGDFGQTTALDADS